ncbi:MAG: hypothetical protein A3D10_08595 [Omnitrophica WOR_2 bacterium RIFCSPHIGHO2_02_FULL_48_11]|nr:MAG: hypothetical protein A3D10_08595 [Omnitrophica WOR_2 bacterium RIFCSPHIGHO2_02_FULL_48_11]
MNKVGKVLTVFLVIFTVLLVSLTAISMFFFQKELERRKAAEELLEQIKGREVKLDGELTEAKKQVELLTQKNKEADDKINGLLDDLELEQGLREAMKKEGESLKDQLTAETQSKEQVRQELNQKLEESQKRIEELQAQLTQEATRSKDLEAAGQQLQEKVNQLESEKSNQPSGKAVQLEKIVVAPGSKEGKVLTVDADNDFVIISLGEKDGLTAGSVMSIYRGESYLGDVKLTRVQPEMSAADFIPPLSSNTVNKNDRVLTKQ